MNTALILRGPILASWRGTSFFHRGKVAVPMEFSAAALDVEPFGMIQDRPDAAKIEIKLTPSGRVNEVESLVNRYQTALNGQLINIEEYPVTVDPATDILSCNSQHLLTTGDEVMAHALVTTPGGLSRTTRYYARVLTTATLTLHTSAAGAAANTGKLDLTTAGSGVVLDITRPLVLHTFNGLKITYFNVGLTDIPQLRFSADAKNTLLGEAGFRAFVRNGQMPDDPTDRYFKIEYEPLNDTSFDPGDIYTDSPTVTWGFGAPWTDGLPTKAGATVDFKMETADLPSDAFGADSLGRIFKSLSLEAKAALQGVTESEVKAALGLQTTLRGANPEIAGLAAELAIATVNNTFVIPLAKLESAPLAYSSEEQRGEEFTFKSQAAFTGGVKNPLYTLN